MCWKTDNVPSTAGLSNEELSKADGTGNLTAAAGGAPPPSDAPDETSDEVRRRRAAEMTRLMLGYGRRSTFSQRADVGTPLLSRKSLTGGS